MELTKLVVCITVFVTKECFGGLTAKTSKLDDLTLIEATLDILESCYADRFGTVGLAGPSVGSIASRISSRNTIIPVKFIDETAMVETKGPVNRLSRYKLPVFVITTTNESALGKTLNQIKRSIWWNHMAFFLLIDFPTTENGCSKAPQLLWVGWEKNLLNVIFLCLNRTRGPSIFTFNPYMDKAPVSWLHQDTFDGFGGHEWNLYEREYRADASRCDGLNFDKTVDIGGYEVRVPFDDMGQWFSETSNSKTFVIDRMQNVTARLLMGSLNATWNMTVDYFKGILTVDLDKTMNSAKSVTDEYTDISLNFVGQNLFLNFDTTHPLNVFYTGILTQYPGNKSQLDKFISVLDRSSRFGVLVVLIVTLLLFKFWFGKSLVMAILNLVLLVCNAGLQRIPERTASRIFLASLFVFTVTIQGIYSGQFAALLTKNIRLPTIDNLEDLARSHHTIYGPSDLRMFFNQSAFAKRYVEVDNIAECYKIVSISSEAACVGTAIMLADAAARKNLHLSRESSDVVYAAYLIRPNWPLEERVNMIIDRALAGGLLETLYSRERAVLMNKIESFENREQESGPKVLTLEHISFAFVILGTGLLCATITFIVEVATFGRAIAIPRFRMRR